MSELINNSHYRKIKLKELILKLHKGEDSVNIRKELISNLGEVPYGEVVEVEQELIKEGLPETEVLKLCDVHGEVLKGNVDLSNAKAIPKGHPVDVFMQENKKLLSVIDRIRDLLINQKNSTEKNFRENIHALQSFFNELIDVDKHYKRKENLVFPYLEQNNITGPPKVMWGKHDEIREQLHGCIKILKTSSLKKEDLDSALELLFYPVLKAMEDMVQKEEEILFPMCMDKLTIENWWEIHNQTLEYGYTLYDPIEEWRPKEIKSSPEKNKESLKNGEIQLPSGRFTTQELISVLNTAPVDMTFVDKNDKVKYFTQGDHRIFSRSRAILNRDVRMCHPPGSVHIVEKIIEDFKKGKATHAPFWIELKGKFIYIEYFALRDENGNYLGTLEVSQDLTEHRKLKGEQRILSYNK